MSRPIIAEDGTVIFDGKIGVFPFTKKVAAYRSSIHRQAGTLETKPIKRITQSVVRRNFIDELLLAIRAKWP